MSFELFVARRLFVSQKGEKRISKPAVLIAQWGVAVGIAVMILSVCIVTGFKHSVREKIVGFGQHIQVRNYEGTMYGEAPVTANDSLLAAIAALQGVDNVQRYVQKPGLIAVGDEFDGIMLKGVGEDYDFSFFAEYLKEGEIPQFSDTASSGGVLLSTRLADRMCVKTGDKVNVYFGCEGKAFHSEGSVRDQPFRDGQCACHYRYVHCAPSQWMGQRQMYRH